MPRQRATAVSWPNKPMPSQRAELALEGRYTRAEVAQISLGFVPQGPQDKWFIYLKDEWLHVHRSQTGTCIFQLNLVPVEDGEGYTAVKAIANRDPAQYRVTDDEYDVQLLSYLVDHLLLGRFAPFPTPRSLAKSDRSRYRRHLMGREDTGGGSITLRMAGNGRE